MTPKQLDAKARRLIRESGGQVTLRCWHGTEAWIAKGHLDRLPSVPRVSATVREQAQITRDLRTLCKESLHNGKTVEDFVGNHTFNPAYLEYLQARFPGAKQVVGYYKLQGMPVLFLVERGRMVAVLAPKS